MTATVRKPKMVGARRRYIATKEGVMPEPSDIKREAVATRVLPYCMGARDYAEAIVILRERKQFSWPEISKWLAVRGAEFSPVSLQMLYRRLRLEREVEITKEARAL